MPKEIEERKIQEHLRLQNIALDQRKKNLCFATGVVCFYLMLIILHVRDKLWVFVASDSILLLYWFFDFKRSWKALSFENLFEETKEEGDD